MKTISLYRYSYWFIILALIARVTIFQRQRDFSIYATVDKAALSEIGLVGIAIVAIFIAPRLKQNLKIVTGSSVGMLLLYYILCLGSSIWSLNYKFTLFRSVEMISLIMLIILAVSYYENFFLAERVYLYISLVSSFFVIIMQLKGVGGQVSQSALHTNQYSAIAAMAFVYCFGESLNSKKNRRKRFLTTLAIIFGCITLMGTSATSNVATFIGLMVVFILVRRKSKIVWFLFISIGLLILYVNGNFEGFWIDLLFPGKTEHDIVTLKGRTHLWDVYLRMFTDKPILGYGFAVVSRMGSYFGTISTTNTHNGFLEVLLGTGILGMSFFVLWMLRLSGEIMKAYKKHFLGIVGFIGAFAVAMVNNMGRSMVGGMFDAPHVLFIVLLSLFVVHIRIQGKKEVVMTREVVVSSGNLKDEALSKSLK